ncbi:MmgE/PrpD family protein [Roseiterribacter gracilis]|uniref:MmgE/PrpD family protein n=1 Tax=Roseiterribacter gracilis TaxID=2812848 RepID=UPI003B435E21
MNAAEQLARHVIETRFEDLPSDAVEKTKIFILDSFGVGVSGSAAVHAASLLRAVQDWGSGDDATVLGLDTRLPAASAAFLNCVQIHNQEFDCVHEGAVLHPMTTALAAGLAAAEQMGGVTGRDLLTAMALAIDVTAGLGIASRSKMKFFRPASAGIFGATAAVAKLRGFTQAQLIDAWGLALAQAAGTMQPHDEGLATLAVQIGFAARGAIVACDFAAAGIPGPRGVIDGEFGYLNLYETAHDIEPVLADLGRVWRITQVSHKPYPTGRAAHAGISGLLALMSAHRFGEDEVERVTLLVPPLIHRLVGRPIERDMPVSYARLCFQYSGAVALQRGFVDIPDFYESALRDPARHALAARIRVEIDGNPNPNAMSPQRIEVRLKNGATRALDIPATLGAPDNPLPRDAHLAKFRRCWSYGARPLDGQAGERAIALVDRLEELDNSNDLTALAVPEP